MSKWLSTDEQGIANAKMDKILETIKNSDKIAMKSLFSKSAIDASINIDESVEELFEFFRGDFVSYNDWNAVNTEETNNYGDRQKTLLSTYDLVTTEQKYRIAIKDVIVDTTNAENVGIYSFYIIKFVDDPYPEFAYRGDENYSPGINFNVKSPPPNDIP